MRDPDDDNSGFFVLMLFAGIVLVLCVCGCGASGHASGSNQAMEQRTERPRTLEYIYDSNDPNAHAIPPEHLKDWWKSVEAKR